MFSPDLEGEVFVLVLLLQTLQLCFPNNTLRVEVKNLGYH